MKKKNIRYSFITLFSVFLFLCFNSISSKPNGYDTSQQSITESESKGKFIPEQKKDYIFTTIEVENQFIEITIVSLLIITAIIIIRKKSRTNKNRI
ncbi:hypothetical protein [Flavobacterium marginilacus]|uniref:hypothetical protein n=1 Tax=Flavobacterium marginilacus TaxID=3003256 RepID=UPI00248D5502|nr:hypothetical protein [Flavobacterium marginilacus]